MHPSGPPRRRRQPTLLAETLANHDVLFVTKTRHSERQGTLWDALGTPSERLVDDGRMTCPVSFSYWRVGRVEPCPT